ncbi:hypothetical protein ZWY2020_014102 [Hordeum vulgare]|nr:hypothetical protein ZWY2020_014102 [Hordeum vulgare]
MGSKGIFKEESEEHKLCCLLRPTPGGRSSHGVRDWFKTIISKKKSKRSKSKHAKKVAAQRNGANLPQQKPSNAPSSSSDPEDNAALEDWAATRIQNAFRRHKSNPVTKQTSATLSYIQSWNKLQAELRNGVLSWSRRRNRKKKQENQVKLDAKLQNLQEVLFLVLTLLHGMGSNTMDEIVARIHLREEAAVKREASHGICWRAKSATSQGNFNYGVGNGGWGWSWMDRWIAARPWEPRSMVTPENPKKGQSKKDNASTNQSALKLQGAISLSNNTNDRKVPKKKSSPSPDKKKPVAKTGRNQGGGPPKRSRMT